MLNTQAPYFYRFKLGNAEATIVSDGTLPLGDPHTNFLGLTQEEIDKQLTSNFLPTSRKNSPGRRPACSSGPICRPVKGFWHGLAGAGSEPAV
jgi:hypothetical protein